MNELAPITMKKKENGRIRADSFYQVVLDLAGCT